MKCACICEKRETLIQADCVYEVICIYTDKHSMSNECMLKAVKSRKLEETHGLVFILTVGSFFFFKSRYLFGI